MSETTCILCGEHAMPRKVPCRNRYEYDCGNCRTQYMTGRLGMLLRREGSKSDPDPRIAFIQRENEAGRRPYI